MKNFKQFLDEKGRCWTGYKPVPGKKPYSKGLKTWYNQAVPFVMSAINSTKNVTDRRMCKIYAFLSPLLYATKENRHARKIKLWYAI